MLRVDHAGELAAVQIYRGQQAVFAGARGKGAASAEFAELGAQEQTHLDAFEAMLAERGVRPSLLSPLWRAAGFALGAATALIGEEAAHACTEAVESVIEKHYAGQITELAAVEPELAGRLERYRAEELDHHDKAIQSGARNAPGYGLITAVVRAGCRAAIKTAERI
ncbi:MAG TPA: demethoxyubiquinone hydroxylase family protein [Caulobacteraceae bacterium]|nr:demethoxyubiquinone hydroxylase family protein [Caulobacteraceae bacterium]